MPCYCCFRNSRTAGITCVWHLTPSKEKKNADDDEFYAFSPPFTTPTSSASRLSAVVVLFYTTCKWIYFAMPQRNFNGSPPRPRVLPLPLSISTFLFFLPTNVSCPLVRRKWPKDFGACLIFYSCGDAGAFLHSPCTNPAPPGFSTPPSAPRKMLRLLGSPFRSWSCLFLLIRCQASCFMYISLGLSGA